MSTAPAATGTLGVGPHGRELRLLRRFATPLETVWAAMTDPAQLVKWIGRWEGDPASGKVTFLMTAEGRDAPPEDCEILQCSPPHRLTVQTSVGPALWHLRCELGHEAGTTTLLFAQRVDDDPLGSIGPGWEYYLDRLSAVLAGEDPAHVDWDDYYPALSEHYEQLGD
ncbi:SRPBCC family protein [Nesterenkonia sp. E16_7]|uniref:SRPBCC family protein n=1 Tax=unclassified Nesterenkonia TaxID=2629769 RepID=UPI001A926031|nr:MULTISPECIES: SRPBCC family protein [unclassified Nesterenkonia]MBO0594836.1 SRPBCC family protein [Nesterenkonia sp. E16_10]MBO0597085.1 SRPBCC family protein [Nesterenkonia sp. E16_7]